MPKLLAVRTSIPNALLLLLGLASVLGFLGRSWPFELVSHLRIQFIYLLSALLVLAVAGKEFGGASIALGLILLNLAVVYGPLERSAALAPGASTARMFFLNVHEGNRNPDAVLALLTQYKPDLVLLIEVNPEWLRAMSQTRPEYPHFHEELRINGGGIAIYSRYPLENVQIIGGEQFGRPVLAAAVKLAGDVLHLVGIHPLPPVSKASWQGRNEQLAEIASIVAGLARPVVVVGDFNNTPWSPHLHDFREQAGLVFGHSGWRLRPTWPANLPLLRLPIDHFFSSPDVSVSHMELGRNVGSDHLPVIVDFGMNAADKQQQPK